MTTVAGSWQFWAILAAVFASLTAIFAKVGVADIGSDFATFLRTLVVVSVLAVGASWLAYFRALKLGQASQVAPVDKLSVVLVAIFGAVFLGERLSPMGWVGVSMVGAGAVVIALS